MIKKNIVALSVHLKQQEEELRLLSFKIFIKKKVLISPRNLDKLRMDLKWGSAGYTQK
jgi:hypothetical protein